MRAPTEVISGRISASDYIEVMDISEAEDVSVSKILNEAVRDLLEKRRRAKAAAG